MKDKSELSPLDQEYWYQRMLKQMSREYKDVATQEEIDKVCKLYASYCISYQELLYRLPQWKKVQPIKGNIKKSKSAPNTHAP